MKTVLEVIFVITCAVCALFESKRTAEYKWFGIYGRVKAFFAVDCMIAGIMVPIGLVYYFVLGLGDGSVIPELHWLTYLLFSIGVLFIGLYLFISSYENCPEMIRARLIPSMIISGLGVIFKTTVFFVFLVWKMDAPKRVTTINGNNYMVYGRDAYNANGERVGVLSNDGSSIESVDTLND